MSLNIKVNRIYINNLLELFKNMKYLKNLSKLYLNSIIILFLILIFMIMEYYITIYLII